MILHIGEIIFVAFEVLGLKISIEMKGTSHVPIRENHKIPKRYTSEQDGFYKLRKHVKFIVLKLRS